MGSPKLHHYVPQFYLRRFTDEEGLFWAWDKIRNKVIRTSPKHVGAGSNFYRLYEFADLGRDPLTMEKQLSDLEGQVSLITGQWLEWLREAKPFERIEIPRMNREIVSLYIATQFCRTADAREIILMLDGLASDPKLTAHENEFLKWGLYLWGQRLVDESMKRLGRTRREPKPVNKLPERVQTEIHTRWLWNLDMVKSIANSIDESIWIFGRNDTEEPFITSDNPVAFHLHEANSHRWVKVGFLSRDAYPVFPLSPKIMMYCYPSEHPKWSALRKFNDTLSPVKFNVALVRHDNGGQVFNAGRFVISPKRDFRYAREFAKTIGTDKNRPPSTDFSQSKSRP